MGNAASGKEIIAKLAEARSRTEIPAIFEDIRETYGVDDIVYHAVNVRGLTKDGAFLRLTYSDAWISRYYDQNYFATDPVVEFGARAFMPFDWSELDWSSKKRREFAEDAEAHAIGTSGLTVPVRGPDGQHAIFSLSSSRPRNSWTRQMQESIGELLNIAHNVHQATIRTEGVGQLFESVALGFRERDVLQWAAAGKTNDEIAVILGIAERTVRVYLDTSRHKLGASNRTHAVARALGLGLIHPPD